MCTPADKVPVKLPVGVAMEAFTGETCMAVPPSTTATMFRKPNVSVPDSAAFQVMPNVPAVAIVKVKLALE